MNAALDRRLAANKALPARNKAERARARRLAAKGLPIVINRAPVAPAIEQLPTTAQGWYDYVHARGFRKLGQGASRKVYALDDNRVIKIDYSGWKQCDNEIKAWEQADESKRSYLAKILDHGDGWIIMERARSTLRDFGAVAIDTISRDLRATTRIADLHANNIGYFGNGIFKIIDYGVN